jgi:hypothetical protein
MPGVSDRDGPPAVAYLDQLAESLAEAHSPPSGLELGAVVQDLTNAAHNARAWAERRGIPAGCVPSEPAGTMTVERAIAFAAELASVLRWLDRYSVVPKSMRDVVLWLRQSRSSALVELDLALVAVDETLGNVLAVRDLAAEQSLALRDAQVDGAADRAERLVGALDRITRSLGEIRRGIRDWAGSAPPAD